MDKCSMGFEECKNPICAISPDPAKPLFELYKEVEQEQLQFQELWQQGHDYHIEEVAKLRKVLELSANMLAYFHCPISSSLTFDLDYDFEDIWLRCVENESLTFCETHCGEDGRDDHTWRCWLDLLMAMVEDQEVRSDG